MSIKRLQELHDIGCKNVDSTSAYLRDIGALPLVASIDDLYEHLTANRQMHPDNDFDRFQAYLFMLSRRQFPTALYTIMSRRVIDCYPVIRIGIEACAMAIAGSKDPKKVLTWLQAHNDEAAFKKYRREFDRSLQDPDAKPLADYYTYCSKRCHPSIYYMGPLMSIEGDYLTLAPMDPAPGGPGPLLYLVWLCRVNLAIAEAYAPLFKIDQNTGSPSFRSKIKQMKRALKQWDSVVFAQELGRTATKPEEQARPGESPSAPPAA